MQIERIFDHIYVYTSFIKKYFGIVCMPSLIEFSVLSFWAKGSSVKKIDFFAFLKLYNSHEKKACNYIDKLRP